MVADGKTKNPKRLATSSDSGGSAPMREDQAHTLVSTLFATFGKAAPSRGSAIFQAIFDRVAEVSEQAIPYITEHLQDADDLPKNLGKAILAQYFNWQSENGIKVQNEYCRECQGKGGWETIRNHPQFDGKLIYQWAPCPSCSAHLIPHGKQPLHAKDLEESGALVVPPNYPGGRIGYLADKGFIQKTDGKTSYRSVRDAMIKMNHQTGYARDYMQDEPQKSPREQVRLG